MYEWTTGDMTSYLGVFAPNIPVQHSAIVLGPDDDGHGNAVVSYADPVERLAITVYPLHKLPHHDIVGPEYVARVMIDFIMEVPDATVYKKGDLVIWDGLEFAVQGFPFNWAGNDPFGFDSTFFGGSIHILRVT
jgi:hypothetical protein